MNIKYLVKRYMTLVNQKFISKNAHTIPDKEIIQLAKIAGQLYPWCSSPDLQLPTTLTREQFIETVRDFTYQYRYSITSEEETELIKLLNRFQNENKEIE